MPSWSQLVNEFSAQQDRDAWLQAKEIETVNTISKLRNDRNVIVYSSGFLQKPRVPAEKIQITHEDLNGLMSVMMGMDWNKGLTLLLHTPGGVTNAAETIVAYLWSKFDYIEVIVPTLAMSAGTMIALASDKIIMGRPSQLGPIDPQFLIPGGAVSARAIVDQFEAARTDILANLQSAHLWAPILQTIGPALLQEAKNALDYSETMVARWLAKRMFSKLPDAEGKAKKTAKFFNHASYHKSHGRRIDRDEARTQNVVVEELEKTQELQEAVLTCYHVHTLVFDQSPATKMAVSSTGNRWIKNHV